MVEQGNTFKTLAPHQSQTQQSWPVPQGSPTLFVSTMTKMHLSSVRMTPENLITQSPSPIIESEGHILPELRPRPGYRAADLFREPTGSFPHLEPVG